jgi:uncharacterized protein YeaO (DUF488 family)
MAIHIVQLGSPRRPDEGLRLGTVRRPPRGVPKAEFARRDFYDVWQPLLSPSAELVAEAKLEDEAHCHRSVLRELLEARGAKVI